MIAAAAARPRKPMPGRVPYAVAGAAHRDTLERAMREDLPPIAVKVLMAVLALTTAWSKLMDSTSARQLAAIVYGLDDAEDVQGWQRKRVSEALALLGGLGLIGYESTRGKWARSLVWVGTVSNDPYVEDIDEPDPIQRTPTQSLMTPDAVANDPRQRGNTEKYYREAEYRAPVLPMDDFVRSVYLAFGPKGFSEVDCANTVAALRKSHITETALNDALTLAAARPDSTLGTFNAYARSPLSRKALGVSA